MDNDLQTAMYRVAETTTRLATATKNLEVLEADIPNQKTVVADFTTNFVNDNAYNFELKWYLKKTCKELTTAQATTQDAIKAVFEIEGAVSNMTRQIDCAVQTAVVEMVRHV